MTTPLHDIIAKSRRLAPSSKKVYEADIDHWIEFAGADPSGWTLDRAEAFYDQMLERGLKPQSAKRIMMSLRYAAKWWATRQGRPELDFTNIEFVRDRRRKFKEVLTEEQATAILNTCTGSEPRDLRDFAALVVALETGMRVMSLCGMQIETTGVRERSVPVTWVPLKGEGADRYPVPLSNTALLALEPWLAFLRQRKVKTGPVLRALLNRVTKEHQISASLSHRALYDVVQEHAKAAGVEGVHPHLFRHTFVSWRRAAGVTDSHIGMITGHRLAGDPKILWVYTDRSGPEADVARNTTPKWLAEYVLRYKENH